MVRELMEEKLSGVGNVLRIAKDVDAGKYGW
jgi:hypothetical protein